VCSQYQRQSRLINRSEWLSGQRQIATTMPPSPAVGEADDNTSSSNRKGGSGGRSRRRSRKVLGVVAVLTVTLTVVVNAVVSRTFFRADVGLATDAATTTTTTTPIEAIATITAAAVGVAGGRSSHGAAAPTDAVGDDDASGSRRITDEWLRDCARDVKENHPELVTPFRVKPGFADYRLGDCIRMCSGQGCAVAPVGSLSNYYRNLECRRPGYNRKVDRGGNETIIWEALRRYKAYHGLDDGNHEVVPSNDTIVIHLRLGDKLDDTDQHDIPVEDMLIGRGQVGSRGPLPLYGMRNRIKSAYELLYNIAESGYGTVSIVGGSHRERYYLKSRVYANCLHRAIVKSGYNVTMRIDDSDPGTWNLVAGSKFIFSIASVLR